MYSITKSAMISLIAAPLMAATTAASHSQALDYSAESNYGTVSLEAGFMPDPHTVVMTSGGSLDLAMAVPGEDCAGYATANPDLKLQWTQDSEGLLKLWVESDGDTTLVINDSEGNWHCDDDSAGGTNPQVILPAASGGRFDIWVGSYDADANHTATLYISEYGDDGGSSDHELDYTADANYGSVSLEAGFLPDPHTVVMTSGGSLDLAMAVPGEDCAGYATANPDLKLEWSQESEGLLRLWVESEGDTTLVINDSYGEWHCDDDSAGDTNPLVELPAAGGGRFDIWVGSYDADANHTATLYISELE